MIPFTDVAVATYFKGIFLPYTVVYAPPAQSRQALARMSENEHVGIPGISVYRTACPKDKQSYSLPQAFEGQYTRNADGIPQPLPDGTFNSVQIIRVAPQYTTTAWTRDLTTRNLIEKCMWFADVYQTVDFVLKGDGFEVPYTVSIEGDDPEYAEIPDEKTGKTIWYGMTKIFTVRSQWIASRIDPKIEEIILSLQEVVLSGDPIDDIILKTVTIVPKP